MILGTLVWSKGEQSGDVPSPCRAHTAAVVGTDMYIFGGGNGVMPLNKTYKLDTTSLVWTEIRVADPMEPRGYLTSTAVGNYIVFYGGTTDTEVYTDARVLNTST